MGVGFELERFLPSEDRAGEIQAEILDRLCDGLAAVEALDLETARTLIEQRLSPYLSREGVRFTV